MSTYHAPLKDMLFVMNELAGLDQVGKLPGYEDATADTVTAILEEASKFATEVLEPLSFTSSEPDSTSMPNAKSSRNRAVIQYFTPTLCTGTVLPAVRAFLKPMGTSNCPK